MNSFFSEIVESILNEAGNSKNTTRTKIEFVDGNPQNGFYIYHCFHRKDAASIMQKGMRRIFVGKGGGKMYGDGIYSTYTLESSIYNAEESYFNNGWGEPHQLGVRKSMNGGQYLVDLYGNMIKHTYRTYDADDKYGSAIAKCICKSNLKNFLIFDPIITEQVWGKQMTIGEQLQEIFRKDPKVYQLFIDKKTQNLFSSFRLNSHTSDGARESWRIIRDLEVAMGINIRRRYLHGWIYSGNADGNCCIIFNLSEVEPIAYSLDFGQTFTKTDREDWIHKEIVNDYDLEYELRGHYDKYITQGFKDGYAIVYKDGHGYRILSRYLFEQSRKKHNSGDGRITDEWFDEIYGTSFTLNNKLKVKYKGTDFILKKIKVTHYDVYDTEGYYLCNLKDIKNVFNNKTLSNLTADDTDYSNIDFSQF